MKRRSLLMVPLLGWTARALGQDAPRKAKTFGRARQVADDTEDPPRKRAKPKDDAEGQEDEGPKAKSLDAVPANFPTEADFHWETFDIGAYTALTPAAQSPQTAVLDWIFRRTETGPWHGDKVAVLCANRSKIRAYNSKKIIDQVAETVEQFTNAYADILTVRVRFLAAADPRWRYTALSRLTPVGSGPQGQQIWQTAEANIADIIAQMQVWQGFKVLEDKSFEVLNGQTVRVESFLKRPYPGSVQREGAVGLGYQPKIDNLTEGIVLRFSPLLGLDGDTLDAAIELSTNLVRKFHQVKVLGPREVGTGEVTLDVPEGSETRLNQAVKGWSLDQSLIISAGVQPGLLLDKGGWMNLKIPGTTPTATEALVVINVSIASGKNRESAKKREPEKKRESSKTREADGDRGSDQ